METPIIAIPTVEEIASVFRTLDEYQNTIDEQQETIDDQRNAIDQLHQQIFFLRILRKHNLRDILEGQRRIDALEAELAAVRGELEASRRVSVLRII